MERRFQTKMFSPSSKRTFVTASRDQKKIISRHQSGDFTQDYNPSNNIQIQRPSAFRIKTTTNTYEGNKLTNGFKQTKEEKKINISRRLVVHADPRLMVKYNSPRSNSPFPFNTNLNSSYYQKGNQLSNDNVVKGIAFKSICGKTPGITKTNQDVFIMANQINKIPHLHFYAVCDGHGD